MIQVEYFMEQLRHAKLAHAPLERVYRGRM